MPGAQAEPPTPTQYLCIVEHAAGLHYDRQTKVWGPQAFASNGKYIFRRLNDDDRDKQKGNWRYSLAAHPKADWAFFGLGEDMLLLACEWDTRFETFFCRGGTYDGSFNKDSRRFELVLRGGYELSPKLGDGGDQAAAV
jgi:hypothetical protein